MSEELKPCPNPWCAGHQQLPAKGKAGWRVICACGVKTFAHDEMSDAVAQWNTRPAPKADGLEECATIAERDNAELAVSMMYRAVTGKEAQWSSDFRLSHAVREVERLAALKDRDVVLEEWLAEKIEEGIKACQEAEEGEDKDFWRRYWAGYATGLQAFLEKIKERV